VLRPGRPTKLSVPKAGASTSVPAKCSTSVGCSILPALSTGGCAVARTYFLPDPAAEFSEAYSRFPYRYSAILTDSGEKVDNRIV
jgi:hypothetical protein